MNRIYTDQDYFFIELTYKTPLVGTVQSAKMVWYAPDGSTGEWAATINTTTKTIKYSSVVGEFLSPAGRWAVKSIVTFDTGAVLPGTKFKFLVEDPNIEEN